MSEKYENVALPRDMIRQIDFVVKHLKPYGFTSRPEVVKSLVRQYLEKLVELGFIPQDELKRASEKKQFL